MATQENQAPVGEAESSESVKKRINFSDNVRKYPMTWAVLTAAVLSLAGLIAAHKVHDIDLRKVLYAASVTVIFGGLIGGIIAGLLKILFDDFTLRQQKRRDDAAFMTNVLNDLKSVYDRVARVRIVIPAHQSALTYGQEMRDLIDARVTLRNVIRALDRRADVSSEDFRIEINGFVNTMEKYLGELTDEFKVKYKGLSNEQRVYEEEVKAKLKEAGKLATADQVFPKEAVWKELQKLDKLMGLIKDGEESPYRANFESPLDKASGLLREELRRILSSE